MNKNQQRIAKEEADKLMAIPGNVRGAVILADLEYARRKGGIEVIKKIKERLKELGYPVDVEEIKPMEKYPEALSVLIILLVKEVLNLTDEEIFEMGGAAIKLSPFIKILTKYFVSAKRIFEESPKYWEKYFDFGKMEPIEFNGKEGYTILRLIGYKFHPIICIFHKGYFTQVARIATGKKVIKIEETKCVYRGDPYHEYFVSWK